MKLIDKDALVAEIERLKNTSLEYGYNTMQKVLADSGKDISLRQLQNFINDLEVKEVDLKEELANYNMEYVDENGFFNTEHLAEYFFELGIKAQKGEKV